MIGNGVIKGVDRSQALEGLWVRSVLCSSPEYWLGAGVEKDPEAMFKFRGTEQGQEEPVSCICCLRSRDQRAVTENYWKYQYKW